MTLVTIVLQNFEDDPDSVQVDYHSEIGSSPEIDPVLEYARRMIDAISDDISDVGATRV